MSRKKAVFPDPNFDKEYFEETAIKPCLIQLNKMARKHHTFLAKAQKDWYASRNATPQKENASK